METVFIVNEQSIHDMVQRAVQQAMSKRQPVSPPAKDTHASNKNLRRRKNDRSNLEAAKMTDPAQKIGSNGAILARRVAATIIPHKTDAADLNNRGSEKLELVSLETSLHLDSSRKTCEAEGTVS